MKAQSALEFLNVYSFLLIVLAAALIIIFSITSTTKADIRSQCASFSGLNCNFVSYYSNSVAGYALAAFSISNGQSAAINVTSANVVVASKNYSGVCSPAFMLPGQESTCLFNISAGQGQGSPVTGFYTLYASECNSPVSGLISSCNLSVIYGGSFYTYTQTFATPIFSVAAAVGNATAQIVPYNSQPGIPSSYTVVQNDDWEAVWNYTAIKYAFGTTGSSGNYFGVNVIQFPSSLAYLNTNSISCSSPYNSSFSLASTAFYLPANSPVSFNAYATNAVAFYYQVKGGSWNSVFGNALWSTGATESSSNVVTLTKGLYRFAVEWSNVCGSGIQAAKISANSIVT